MLPIQAMIKTQYLDNLDIVVHIGSQTVTTDDLLDTAIAWESHEAFHPGTSAVWDLVAADLEVDWAKVKSDGAEVAKHFEHARDVSGKTAWVISDDVVGVVLDSIHLAFPWPRQWRTFPSAEEAIAWVRAPSAD